MYGQRKYNHAENLVLREMIHGNIEVTIFIYACILRCFELCKWLEQLALPRTRTPLSHAIEGVVEVEVEVEAVVGILSCGTNLLGSSCVLEYCHWSG